MSYNDKAEAIKYNNDYNARVYDRINLIVPKGDKETIKARAAELGQSVNGYINKLIADDLTRRQRIP